MSRLATLGEVRTLSPDTVVIRKGDLETHLFLVEDGTLSVSRGPAPPGDELVEVGPGEIVGELAFFDNRPRMATVVARSPGRVRRFERQEILAAFGDSPMLLRELLEGLMKTRQARLGLARPEETGDARAFVQSLAGEALRHRAVHHPYLQKLAVGSVADLRWALADFARQYYGYSAHFPRYLTTVISRLEVPQHRGALLENLTEESGIYEEEELEELRRFGVDPDWIAGVPHPELFRRFQRALGVSPGRAQDDALEVVCWREMFLSVLSSGTPAEAVGALGLGTETIVRTLYTPLVEAIRRLPDLRAEDTVFFPLHTAWTIITRRPCWRSLPTSRVPIRAAAIWPRE
jgi:hypothetical protein